MMTHRIMSDDDDRNARRRLKDAPSRASAQLGAIESGTRNQAAA
jgi:hypothetical protein